MPDQPWFETACFRESMLDLEALLRVPYVDPDGRFSISPDGSQVAFAWNRTGQWEIYLLHLAGPGVPLQLTSGKGAKLAPQWSRDGSQLAYVLDPNGGERYDICIYDLASGAHTNLTPKTPYFIQPHLDWSPSDPHLAFASDHSGRFEVYSIHSSGGNLRYLAGFPSSAYAVRWSPDASWLAVMVVGHGPDFEIYLSHPKTGRSFPLSHDGVPFSACQPSWSPDGRVLAFESDLHGVYEIGLYELETGLFRWPSSGDGEKHAPAWSPDGSRLVYIHQWGSTTALVILDLESGQQEFFRAGAGVHYAPAFTPDGRSVLFVFDSPGQPDDLWRLDLASGSLQQLTFSLPDELIGASFVLPEEVTYPSLDGQSVPALLYRPSHADENQPAVIDIHGGPNWSFQASWDPLVQHMLSRGWIVLAPNYRGSTGYGRSWQLANRFDMIGGDTGDIAAGVDFLLDMGLADPQRIALTGRSYGGYLTMTCLTRFPERWAGGSAVVPFLNWFTSGEESRQDLQEWDLENFGHPEKDYRRYYEHSPYFFLERVQTPVQLVCGAHDPRCPASQSVQAWAALQAYGKPVDFVLYPDEGHQFLKIGNVVDSKRRTVDFLAKVLEKGRSR
jgi:dipeptidyl aminopeptidase/acylaminoacyl peptidase